MLFAWAWAGFYLLDYEWLPCGYPTEEIETPPSSTHNNNQERVEPHESLPPPFPLWDAEGLHLSCSQQSFGCDWKFDQIPFKGRSKNEITRLRKTSGPERTGNFQVIGDSKGEMSMEWQGQIAPEWKKEQIVTSRNQQEPATSPESSCKVRRGSQLHSEGGLCVPEERFLRWKWAWRTVD